MYLCVCLMMLSFDPIVHLTTSMIGGCRRCAQCVEGEKTTTTITTLSYTSVDYSLAHVDLSSNPSNPAYRLVQEDKFSGSNNPTQSTS